MNIAGPVSLVVIALREKFFYLFGDNHRDTNNDCDENDSISIIEVIEEIIRANESFDHPTDIFIEEAYTTDVTRKAVEYESENWLTFTRNRFKECLSHGSSSCGFDSNITKFHSTDIRFSMVEGNVIKTEIFYLFFSYFNSLFNIVSSAFESGNPDRELVVNLLKNFTDTYALARHLVSEFDHYFNTECLSSQYSRDVENYPIKGLLQRMNVKDLAIKYGNDINMLKRTAEIDIDADKVYSRIGYELSQLNANDSDKVYSFFKNMAKGYINGFNTDLLADIRSFVPKTKTLSSSEILSGIIDLITKSNFEHLLYCGSCVMDVYSISRMLKIVNQPGDIISYSGDKHNEHYYKFLSVMLDGEIYEHVTDKQFGTLRCITSDILADKLRS